MVLGFCASSVLELCLLPGCLINYGVFMRSPSVELSCKSRVVEKSHKMSVSAAAFTAHIHLPSSDLAEYGWWQLWHHENPGLCLCFLHTSTEKALRVGVLLRPVLGRCLVWSLGGFLLPARLLWAPQQMGYHRWTSWAVRHALRGFDELWQVFLLSRTRKVNCSILEQQKKDLMVLVHIHSVPLLISAKQKENRWTFS